MQTELGWSRLLSRRRFADAHTAAPTVQPEWQIAHARTPAERDYDRILYAAATRRMADKTQVFPLEPNTSIRNRLTHSHEVSNIARSIGNYLVHEQAPFIQLEPDQRRDIPAMLAAIGLVHDIGNPPFGHSGEDAISSWFARQCERHADFKAQLLSWPWQNDFLKFEGNAQTLRHLTRLQVSDKSCGLNLTLGTLAAAMKYTVGSGQADRTSPIAAQRKYGYFQSEAVTAAAVLEEIGLQPGQRHPLAILMEACDDTAYTVLDTEDTIKKRLLTFEQLLIELRGTGNSSGDPVIDYVIDNSQAAHNSYRGLQLSVSELNDVSMQRFRTLAINAIVTNVIHAFMDNYVPIMAADFHDTLLRSSRAGPLVERLRAVDIKYAYTNSAVLALQQQGRAALHDVMDQLWHGILQYGHGDPVADHAYSRISENYRRQFAHDLQRGELPELYWQCRLLTDMVAGMADTFTLDLRRDLQTVEKTTEPNA